MLPHDIWPFEPDEASQTVDPQHWWQHDAKYHIKMLLIKFPHTHTRAISTVQGDLLWTNDLNANVADEPPLIRQAGEHQQWRVMNRPAGPQHWGRGGTKQTRATFLH